MDSKSAIGIFNPPWQQNYCNSISFTVEGKGNWLGHKVLFFFRNDSTILLRIATRFFYEKVFDKKAEVTNQKIENFKIVLLVAPIR